MTSAFTPPVRCPARVARRPPVPLPACPLSGAPGRRAAPLLPSEPNSGYEGGCSYLCPLKTRFQWTNSSLRPRRHGCNQGGQHRIHAPVPARSVTHGAITTCRLCHARPEERTERIPPQGLNTRPVPEWRWLSLCQSRKNGCPLESGQPFLSVRLFAEFGQRGNGKPDQRDDKENAEQSVAEHGQDRNQIRNILHHDEFLLSGHKAQNHAACDHRGHLPGNIRADRMHQ